MPEPIPATHAVTNQSPPFADLNLYLSDAALQDAAYPACAVNRWR